MNFLEVDWERRLRISNRNLITAEESLSPRESLEIEILCDRALCKNLLVSDLLKESLYIQAYCKNLLKKILLGTSS